MLCETQKQKFEEIDGQLSRIGYVTEENEDKINYIMKSPVVYDDAKQADQNLSALFSHSDMDYTNNDGDKSYFDYVLRLYLQVPATFYNDLDSLKTKMLIYSAPDRSFKIYSFRVGGGTQDFYKQYIQYRNADGKITYKPFYLFGIEGEKTANLSNPIIYDVYPFISKGQWHYLLLMEKKYSNTDIVSYITVATFKNGTPEYHADFFPKKYRTDFCIEIWHASELKYNPLTYEISYKEKVDAQQPIKSHKLKLLMP